MNSLRKLSALCDQVIEFALGAGGKIRHIPMSERLAIAKKLKADLGFHAPALGTGDRSTRSALPAPRMVRTDKGDLMLTYRGAGPHGTKRPSLRSRGIKETVAYDTDPRGPWADPPPSPVPLHVARKHVMKEALATRDRRDWAMHQTLGTTTDKRVAEHFRKMRDHPKGHGRIATYATPIDKIVERHKRGKLGFPGRGDPFQNTWEQEISQPNGGNLIRVRKGSGHRE